MVNNPDMALAKLSDVPNSDKWGDSPIFEDLKVIAYKPELARYLGSIEASVFYQQLNHWQKYAKQLDGYFYKSAVEMEQETFITEKQQRRCREQLRQLGWIDTKKKMANGHPTYHYKVLVRTIGIVIPTGEMPDGTSQKASSITKNTTQEITYTSEMVEKINKVYKAWLIFMVVDPEIRFRGDADSRSTALKVATKSYRLTDKRRATIARRIKDSSYERVMRAIKSISQSDFHRGENDRHWSADMEWLLKSYEKVEEWANKFKKEDE